MAGMGWAGGGDRTGRQVEQPLGELDRNGRPGYGDWRQAGRARFQDARRAARAGAGRVPGGNRGRRQPEAAESPPAGEKGSPGRGRGHRGRAGPWGERFSRTESMRCWRGC